MGVAECTRYGLESLSRFTHLISQQAYDERNPHYHILHLRKLRHRKVKSLSEGKKTTSKYEAHEEGGSIFSRSEMQGKATPKKMYSFSFVLGISTPLLLRH